MAALLGELSATRTRATQAEADKARAAAAAAAAAAAVPQPAASDESKRLLSQLATLNDEVCRPPSLIAFEVHLPTEFFIIIPDFISLIFQMARVRSNHLQMEAEAQALREEIA